MLYHWYELGHAAVRPVRAAAGSARLLLSNPFNPLMHTSVARHTAAALEVFERTTRRYDKPGYRIDRTRVDGTEVGVSEEVVWQHPFCRLVHFKRAISAERAARDPRLLLVAPMSGHFATLLRGTVETFLPDHEVYITDWQDARDVPLSAGAFHLEDYTDAMIAMFRHFGGDVHVFAVCQPSVPVLAAVSLMEAEGDPAVPHSMSLAGGPIDTRRSRTIVNQLAEQRGTEWFRRNVITPVPWPNAGAGRSVYPGFLQLSGFMTMNLDRHMNAHKDLFFHLVRGDGDSAEKHCEFYDEYLAVMDLTAEFYLDTVDTVFVRHLLAKGEMRHRGQLVDPGAIHRVGLLTIEGEKDDITGLGQCRAAHDLCTSLPDSDKMHFTCPHVGHYGIFNGSRFRREIAPRIAAFARARDPRTKAGIAAPALDRRAMYETSDPERREISSSAFTFGSHAVARPVRAAKRRNDAAAPKRASHAFAADALYLPQLAQLTMLQLAGSLFLDGLRVWHQ
ncbi:MAG TPA: polyhydroxyalkanoate depolymerase [Hyphomicrobiaceae bacterium]|nr:polyhydroxyalkanoate depolymerase [Hyphomicrobiaceae bacterium]